MYVTWIWCPLVHEWMKKMWYLHAVGMIWYCYIIKNIMSLTDETGDSSMLNEVNQIRRINIDFYIWNPGLWGEYERESVRSMVWGSGKKGGRNLRANVTKICYMHTCKCHYETLFQLNWYVLIIPTDWHCSQPCSEISLQRAAGNTETCNWSKCWGQVSA